MVRSLASTLFHLPALSNMLHKVGMSLEVKGKLCMEHIHLYRRHRMLVVQVAVVQRLLSRSACGTLLSTP